MNIRTITHSTVFNRPVLHFKPGQASSGLMAHSNVLTAVITEVVDPYETNKELTKSKTIVFTIPSALNENHISVIAIANSIPTGSTISLTSSWLPTTTVITANREKPIHELAKLVKTALIGDTELTEGSEEILMDRVNEFLNDLLFVII